MSKHESNKIEPYVLKLASLSSESHRLLLNKGETKEGQNQLHNTLYESHSQTSTTSAVQ